MIETLIVKGHPNSLKEQRINRIKEALSFEKGTKDKPIKHTISVLNNNVEVCFYKPGKEALRENNVKINDMLPIVNNGKFESFSFEDIWCYLLKISIVKTNEFKQVLTFIYRLAYHIDHKEINKKIRYNPNDVTMNFISDLNDKIRKDYVDYELYEFLHFLDLLGWNEDIKYHTTGTECIFDTSNYKKGRLNTLLSCIAVPYLISDFLKDTLNRLNNLKDINYRKVLTAMQRLAKTRGICVPTQTELLSWLNPYLIN